MGGVDKTAIEVDGVAIVDRVRDALVSTCDRVAVIGRGAPGGPAAAVASVANEIGAAEMVVVVAGDLPLLRTDHVEALVAAVEHADAAAALDDRGLPNPLVAAYRAAQLRATIEGIVDGDRADRLLPPHTRTVALDADATFSVNTPEDLEEARRRLLGEG